MCVTEIDKITFSHMRIANKDAFEIFWYKLKNRGVMVLDNFHATNLEEVMGK